MSTGSLRKVGAGLVIAAFLWSCDGPMALEEVEVIPAAHLLANSVEEEIIFGEVPEDDVETIPEGSGEPPLPQDLPPFVSINAPASVEAGTTLRFDVEVHSFAPGAVTYKVSAWNAGAGFYWYTAGTVAWQRKTFSFSKVAEEPGKFAQLKAAATNANGTGSERASVQVLPRRPRFAAGADFLPPTMVAGSTSERDLFLVKPAQPSASDYVLPLTVDFGDGRTQSYDWDVVQEWDGAFKTIPMTWLKPGTYTVTFKVAATSAPAYSSTHTESITILPNPKWPHITEFASPARVIYGRNYEISFNPGGPDYPGELFDVRTYKEDGSSGLTHAPPGGPGYLLFNWPAVFGRVWQTTIVSGTVDGVLRADTLRWSVLVETEPIVIGSFVGPADVNFGEEASFSFRADGPGPGPYTATITYGDGSAATVLEIAPGATVTHAHTWPVSGLWDLKIVVDNGVVSTTVTEEVTVNRPRPTIDDLSIVGVAPGTPPPAQDATPVVEETIFPGESVFISFVPNDAGNVNMFFEVQMIRNPGGPLPRASQPAEPGQRRNWGFSAGNFTLGGVYEFEIVVGSHQNGLRLVSDTAYHTLTVGSACSAGSYWDGSACVAAPAGYHVPDDGAFEAVPCPVGTYQDQAGQTSCIDAPAGSFVASTGATQATLCPVGYYQDGQGAALCKEAQRGQFVDRVGATQATLCAAGTFQPATGSVSCEPAPRGWFVTGLGQAQAERCAPGFYSDHEGAAACTPAPAGRFVAAAGATSAVDCAVGTFQALPGQTGCDPAPAGSYVDLTGATQATACSPGTFQAAAGSTSCGAAAPGSYVSISGATQATLCAPGTFQPAAGSTSCVTAAPGSYVSISGATQATSCSPGTFQPATGQTGCLGAPIGSYVDVTGAAAASPCPVTTSTLGTGSTSADQCIPLGRIAESEIAQAVSEGTLVPASGGNGGQKQLESWSGDLSRSFKFLDGRQQQAGCSGVRIGRSKADGQPSPKDVVAGPARAGVEASLSRIVKEYGC